MAKPVTRESGLQVLEDAIHLLRRTSFATLAWHWAGSAPFALAAAFFWSGVTHPRTAAGTGFPYAAQAFVLALLLAWMNCCRAAFAARLRGLLSGQGERAWPLRRLWTIAPGQVLLGASKLVALPVAAVFVAPLASTVSFYRNAAALTGRDDLDPLALIAMARRLAAFRPRQNWTMLGFLSVLYLLALVNAAAALAILPGLVRMLTGYESVFSRAGIYFADNPAFWMCSFAIAWMAFDPFVQAAHCVRCFQAESAETGEDLKATLRTLVQAARPAATMLLMVVLLSGGIAMRARPLVGQAVPPARAPSLGPAGRACPTPTGVCESGPSAPTLAAPPDSLGRAIRQAVQSPEYDWRLPPAGLGTREPWIAAATDRAIEACRSFLRAVGRAIKRFLDWLFGPRQPAPAPGKLPLLSLPIGVYVLTALVLALCAVLAARFRSSRRSARAGIPAPVVAAVPLDGGGMNPLDLPEQSWIELAERSLLESHWRLALRALYLANLAWLGRREIIALHPGKTNREYEVELRRRTRAVPRIRELFVRNLAAFERSWYGMHDPGPDDVALFRRTFDEMKTALEAAA